MTDVEQRAQRAREIEAIAREALFGTEMARTDVVNPVNGTAPYSYVSFHGQLVEFGDGEFTTEMHRDAGTGKAAAYAAKINDALFDLAKRAVAAAFAAERPALSPAPVKQSLTTGEVTQADRDAAADFVRAWDDRYGDGQNDFGPSEVDSVWLRSGDHDEELIIQAFARHRLSAPPIPATGGGKTEYGWLIERGDSEASEPKYWAAGQTDPKRPSAWTSNHNQAIRHARKEDAEMVARRILKGVPVRICEHAWDNPAALSPTPVAKAGPALCVKCQRTISEHWDFPAVCDKFAMAEPTPVAGGGHE